MKLYYGNKAKINIAKAIYIKATPSMLRLIVIISIKGYKEDLFTNLQLNKSLIEEIFTKALSRATHENVI